MSFCKINTEDKIIGGGQPQNVLSFVMNNFSSIQLASTIYNKLMKRHFFRIVSSCQTISNVWLFAFNTGLVTFPPSSDSDSCFSKHNHGVSIDKLMASNIAMTAKSDPSSVTAGIGGSNISSYNQNPGYFHVLAM